MYTLYYLTGACSLAVQTVIHELNQDVNIVEKNSVDYNAINPIGAVPVLVDGDKHLREGAAVMLYLLDKHNSPMLPKSGPAREKAIEDIMFANATVHPAYSHLFFLAGAVSDEKAKLEGMQAAAANINKLWKFVDDKLANQPFLGGDTHSAADIMLAVYSTWGPYFPVEINLGKNVEAMIEKIKALPSYQRAYNAEQEKAAA